MAPAYEGALVGGHPALDFLNTIHDWTVVPPRDYLVDFAAAAGFGVAAGVLSSAEGRQLASARGRRELAKLQGLRSLLERLFRVAVNGKAAAASDLAELARREAKVARGVRYRGVAGAPLRRDIAIDLAGPAVLRLRLVDAAARLLVSPELLRVKDCPACGWFFLDQSKNRSRRWCSMETCGASAKAKAYYRRTRGRGVSAAGIVAAPEPAREPNDGGSEDTREDA